MPKTKEPGPSGEGPQCYAESPGPLGLNDHADPDEMSFAVGDSPGVCGLNDAADMDFEGTLPPPQEIPVLCFNLEEVERSLHSVAFWRIQHKYLSVQFVKDDDAFWKVLDTVVFWGDAHPGTVEVSLGDKKVVQKEVDELSKSLLEQFLDKASEGPKAVAEWLRKQQEIKQICETGFKQTLDKVIAINMEIADAMRTPLKVLRTVKFGTDLVAEGIGIVNPLYTVGYTFVTVFAEEYSKAQAVAIVDPRQEEDSEAAQRALKEGAKKAATSDEAVEIYGKVPEKMEKTFTKNVERATQQMKSHDEAIKKSEAKIRKHPKAPVKKANARNMIRKHVEKKTIAHGKVLKNAGRKAATKSFNKVFKKVLFVYQLYDWVNLGYEYGTDMQSYDD